MHQKDDRREKTAEEKNKKGTADVTRENAAQAEPAADTPRDDVTMTQAEFLQVKEHIEKLSTERDELINLAKRTQADFDNYRKRNAQVYCDSLEEGVRGLMKELLPVIDNFDRAFLSDGEGEAWREGVKLVYRQFMGVLEKNGLSEIEAGGKFDPELHEAVLRGEQEGKEEGDILEVLQRVIK